MGNPLRFLLTGGQQHDITQADDLIADFDFERVIADRSYDADDFLKKIAEKEAEAVIPPRKNRKEQREYDRNLYKEGHLINVSSTKSSITGVSSQGLRNSISACSASSALLAH